MWRIGWLCHFAVPATAVAAETAAGHEPCRRKHALSSGSSQSSNATQRVSMCPQLILLHIQQPLASRAAGSRAVVELAVLKATTGGGARASIVKAPSWLAQQLRSGAAAAAACAALCAADFLLVNSATQTPCSAAGRGSVVMCSTFSRHCFGKCVLCWPAAEVTASAAVLLDGVCMEAGTGCVTACRSRVAAQAAQLHTARSNTLSPETSRQTLQQPWQPSTSKQPLSGSQAAQQCKCRQARRLLLYSSCSRVAGGLALISRLPLLLCLLLLCAATGLAVMTMAGAAAAIGAEAGAEVSPGEAVQHSW
jgi:hypothetical protein